MTDSPESPDPSAGVAFAQLTHPGLLRKANEDASGASPSHGVFLVCDGMGGAAAGEVASHLAVATFLAYMESASPAEPPHRRLHQAILAANTAVFRQARESSGQSGMGTTLVAVHVDPTQITVAHVGDSRCYLLRAAALTLLTGDHSLVEEQVRAGFLTRQEADLSPVRHVITRAIGSGPRVEPEIQTLPACPGDLLLLASDGLNRELTDDEIGRILASLPPYPRRQELEAACRELVACANAQGGRDNVTVLLLALP